MAEISVLIPVYNVETYLTQCMDSILKQSFMDMEIICVDDGSTDSSGIILDQYAASDQRIKVIHKENTGYGHSMNVALKLATGNYIAVLESDDFAEPDMLQVLYEAAVMHDAEVTKGTFYNYRCGKSAVSQRMDKYPKKVLLNSNSCPDILDLADTIWSCLYKHSFLTENNIRFHETPGASYQDISFALQVWLQAKKVYFIDRPIIHYRRDNPGSSMNDARKIFCVFDEYEWVEKKFQSFLENNRKINTCLTAVKYRDYFNHYCRVGPQYQYTLLCRIESALKKDMSAGNILENAFQPRVWDMICRMTRDRERFFSETSKRIIESGPEQYEFENSIFYGNALLEMLGQCAQLIIYGAGQVGKHMASAVLACGGNIMGFAVTSMAGQNSVCMGIPVREIEEYREVAESSVLVVAVTVQNQHKIFGSLQEYGFRHIFRVDEAVRASKAWEKTAGRN